MLFCCLWRNVEASCHKHFAVLSRNQHCRLLPAISVTTCGTVLRRRRVDNTWPVTALARSEAIYRLKIAISAYLTCILRPPPVGEGVHVGILPKHLVRKKLEWRGYSTVKFFLKICLFVLTQYTNVTGTHTQIHRQTDGHRMTANASLA